MNAILGALFAALLVAVIGLSAQRVMPQGTLAALRIGLGVVAAAGAVWALLARQAAIALGLVGIAMALLRPLLGAMRARPTPGRVSEARSPALAMTLDHDSGEMDGEVLAGRFAGRRLSELHEDELRGFFEEAEAEGDEETLALLAAYLERRGVETGGDGPPPQPGAMSEEDAYRMLGLEPGASLEEVRAAYRRLIRKVHPDLGGSPALAALLNAAKKRLDPG
jgi:hypothetical protein